jgi:hypothetical protein
MAARTLFLCIVMVGAPLAHAEAPRSAQLADKPVAQPGARGITPPAPVVRRPVAVIDLTNDQAVRDVANKLLERLAVSAELAPPAISDAAALVDKLPPDDELRITQAQRKRLSAEQNLAQRNFREAAIDAVEGQELLLRVTPRAAIALYADLALALGQSRLGEQKEAEAREAFALTYRLDPTRTLDDLHYLPEVVQSFEAAKKVSPGVGTIAVRGAGRVWIDGEEVGAAPGEFKIPLGRHVVWLTGLLRDTAGKEVLVTQSRTADATIMDGPLTRPQKVVRFRLALSQAQDASVRASAIGELAAFVNVHDVVLLSAVNGRIVWQTWRDREPGFSAPRELGREGPGEILKQIAPPRPLDDSPPVALPEPAPRWYRRRPVQLGIAATVVAAVVGGYLWVRSTEPGTFQFNPDITGPKTGGK